MDSDKISLQTSPYRRGAETGLFFGAYFSALILAGVYSAAIPLLSILVLALLAAFPAAVYRKQRKAYLSDPQPAQITAVWIHGITMIACGALIAALLILVLFKWINPDYFANQLRVLVETYEQTHEPALHDAAQTAALMLERNAIPTPATLTLGFWLFTVASGSILAGLMAVIARLMGHPANASRRSRSN